MKTKVERPLSTTPDWVLSTLAEQCLKAFISTPWKRLWELEGAVDNDRPISTMPKRSHSLLTLYYLVLDRNIFITVMMPQTYASDLRDNFTTRLLTHSFQWLQEHNKPRP
jgi:hypothetical protein